MHSRGPVEHRVVTENEVTPQSAVQAVVSSPSHEDVMPAVAANPVVSANSPPGGTDLNRPIVHEDDESVVPDEEIIIGQGSTQAIRSAAVRKGMRTLRESGLLSIYDGDTTIEEIVRETLQAEI